MTVFVTAIGLVAIVYVAAAEVLFVSHLFSPLTLFHALALDKGAIGLHFAVIIGVLALTPIGLLFGMSTRIAKTRPCTSAVTRRVSRILARRVEEGVEPSPLIRQSAFDELPWLAPIRILKLSLIQVPCAPPYSSGLTPRAHHALVSH